MQFNISIFARLTDRSIIALVWGVVALALIVAVLAFAAFLAVGAGWVTAGPLMAFFLALKALAMMAWVL